MTKRRISQLVILTVALAVPVVAKLSSARAQCPVEPDSIAVIQDGVIQAEILRLDPDPERYVEHWVLYPGYIYPSPTSGVVTELRPGYRTYRDLADFFARVPFAPGSRYVKADCFDGTTLPRR